MGCLLYFCVLSFLRFYSCSVCLRYFYFRLYLANPLMADSVLKSNSCLFISHHNNVDKKGAYSIKNVVQPSSVQGRLHNGGMVRDAPWRKLVGGNL